MNPESKVTAEHLQRAAYLYIRQSTLRQVLENTESTERQYALRQRAVSLGWPEDHIVVIDHDQGQSGASASEREGFQRLVAAVGLGEDPKGGALFVFCNRRHTRIKILCWDGTGLWILTNSLVSHCPVEAFRNATLVLNVLYESLPRGRITHGRPMATCGSRKEI